MGLPDEEDEECEAPGPRTGKKWWEWGFSLPYIGQLPVASPRFWINISRYQWFVWPGAQHVPFYSLFLPLPPPCCRPLLLPVALMAEEWLDCPALGPGWKRREVFRKSGATCGRSDTYYQRYWLGCEQSQGRALPG